MAQNNLIDTSNVTVAAFNAIKSQEKDDKVILGRDDKTFSKSPNHKVKIKVVTNQDNQTHTYFHSFSADAQVTDFLHTCELRCPFDSDLLEYWEIIRQSCSIWGANQGDYKLLFIGRVREVVQDGYELSIILQNYGWKFKQDVSQSYANDNVLNKNGYQIITVMMEALKIDSYIISESAKARLKQVGINSDGNLTVNGEEIEEMPDLLERLKASDPSKLVSKNTLDQKVKESELHNIEDINYTLKYEEKTPVMKQLDSEGGSYQAGSNIYGSGQVWGSGGGTAGSDSAKATDYNANAGITSEKLAGSGKNPNCNNVPSWVCSTVKNSAMNQAMRQVWLYQRACTSDINTPQRAISEYARRYPSYYNSQVKPCLQTMAKFSQNRINGASYCLTNANNAATARNVGPANSAKFA